MRSILTTSASICIHRLTAWQRVHFWKGNQPCSNLQASVVFDWSLQSLNEPAVCFLIPFVPSQTIYLAPVLRLIWNPPLIAYPVLIYSSIVMQITPFPVLRIIHSLSKTEEMSAFLLTIPFFRTTVWDYLISHALDCISVCCIDFSPPALPELCSLLIIVM